MKCELKLEKCESFCNEKQVFPAMQYFVEEMDLTVNAAAKEVSNITAGLVTQGRARLVWQNRTPSLHKRATEKEKPQDTEQIQVVVTEPYSVKQAAEDIAKETNKHIKKRRKEEAEKRKEKAGRELVEKAETLEERDKFKIIYADPPWRYEYSQSESREIENQYPTMECDEIIAMPVIGIVADDAILFLWATSPKLLEALSVLKAWGFDYRTCAVWDKGKIGMGYYFRQQHELLLVGKRGTPEVPKPENRVSSVIFSPRESHSCKPDVVYEIIERMYPSFKKIELFARRRRDGWAAWGDEA